MVINDMKPVKIVVNFRVYIMFYNKDHFQLKYNI